MSELKNDKPRSTFQEILSGSGSSGSITKKALIGSVWTLIGTFGILFLRLVSSFIMSRLLYPEAFGLMTIVYIFLIGLHLFSDFGIRDSIIKNHRGEETNFLDTAWTIQVIRGFGIWLIVLIISWPLALSYNQPELAWLLPFTGITAIIQGFNSTKEHILNRNLTYRPGTLIDLFSTGLCFFIQIVLAYFWRSVWVFVIGGNIQVLVRMILGHWIYPKPLNRFCWDRSVLVEISHLGKFIFFNTMLAFLISQGDRLILGRYLTTAMLGVYGNAFQISEAVSGLCMSLASKVLFPAFSQIARRDTASLLPAIIRVRKYMDMLVLPLIGCLIVFAPLLIKILYDARYQEAGWILQILGFRCAAYPFISIGANTLLSIGKPKYHALSQICKIIVLCLGIPAGWYLAGFHGAVWAIVLADFAIIPALWIGLNGNGLTDLLTDILAVIYFLLGLILAYCLNQGLIFLFPFLNV